MDDAVKPTAPVDDRPPRIHQGLSPSSMALFLACQRKYYLKKIAKLPADDDASEDTESFRVGKAFHKVLENRWHDLIGLRLTEVVDVVKSFDLDPDHHGPLIFAMLASYKKVHEKAGLIAVACEQVIDTPEFYGFVDVILQGPLGWWIGDMKTASQYSQHLMPTLPTHPQLSLYAMHVPEIAQAIGLDPALYLGCRYRQTTKSKASKRTSESPTQFAARLMEGGSIASYDYVIPKEVMSLEGVWFTHKHARGLATSGKEDWQFLPNYGNCLSYFRPCEMWSRCHGKRFSDLQDLVVLKSD